MKKFMVYFEDSENVYKAAIPAKDQKAAAEYVKGNGDIIAIKEVTNDYHISLDKVADALQKAGFGEYEMDFITRTLSQCNIAE